MTVRSIRLALVGAGPWGQKLIAALARLPGVELRAVASRNPATRSLVAKDCAVTADWRALARDSAIEGVAIATPPALHAEMALVFLAAGKAVFVEKPLALDPASAEAVLVRAKQAGVVAMTNHVHLFHPAYVELKRQLPAFGPIHGIRTRGGRRGPFRTEVPVLWDWGPHDVAFAAEGKAETIPVAATPPLERALADFADKIRAGRPDIAQLVLGVAVTKVLARAERALALGRPA